MQIRARRRSLWALLGSMVLAVIALVGQGAAARLYAAEVPCSCSANCLTGSCSCSGKMFCNCSCLFFKGHCFCDEIPVLEIPTPG